MADSIAGRSHGFATAICDSCERIFCGKCAARRALGADRVVRVRTRDDVPRPRCPCGGTMAIGRTGMRKGDVLAPAQPVQGALGCGGLLALVGAFALTSTFDSLLPGALIGGAIGAVVGGVIWSTPVRR